MQMIQRYAPMVLVLLGIMLLATTASAREGTELAGPIPPARATFWSDNNIALNAINLGRGTAILAETDTGIAIVVDSDETGIAVAGDPAIQLAGNIEVGNWSLLRVRKICFGLNNTPCLASCLGDKLCWEANGYQFVVSTEALTDPMEKIK